MLEILASMRVLQAFKVAVVLFSDQCVWLVEALFGSGGESRDFAGGYDGP